MDLKDITNDLKKYSIEEVLSKYDITWSELIRIQSEKHIIDEYDKGYPKYVTVNQKTGKYMIIKDKIYYGSYNTITEAKTIQEELILCNWNKKLIPYLLKKQDIDSNTEYLK